MTNKVALALLREGEGHFVMSGRGRESALSLGRVAIARSDELLALVGPEVFRRR